MSMSDMLVWLSYMMHIMKIGIVQIPDENFPQSGSFVLEMVWV